MPVDSLPKLAAPAQRALAAAGIRSLSDVAQRSRAEVARLHGLGPAALASLESALSGSELAFAEPRLPLVKELLKALSDAESGASLARLW